MNLKKMLSLTLSTALTLSLATPALASGRYWYAEAMDYVLENDLMELGVQPKEDATTEAVLNALYAREGVVEGTDAADWWAAFTGEEVPAEGTLTRAAAKDILAAYAAEKGLPADALMAGNENGDLMLEKNLTNAELAQLLLNLSKLAKYHVAVLVPNPTDGSYFEAGVNGAKALADVEVDVVAMGNIAAGDAMPTQEEELAKYQPFFTAACESGKYDLIITAGGECNPALVDAAKTYPEQKFMSYDIQTVPDALAAGELNNVYGVTYKNQDLGYLAGFIASKITTSEMENANEDKKIGIILGMDVPGINDYAGSFCQAAKAEGVTVYVDYVGDFLADLAPVAAEKAKAMYEDGVDVIWQVAGGAGKGVFTAAAECGKYALGVDCDQTKTLEKADEAATIVTSFFANSPAVIADVWEALLNDEFPGGQCPAVGLAEGFVGYADNEQFQAMTSEELRASVAELFETMGKGEIEVFQVTADAEGWEQLKADVAP